MKAGRLGGCLRKEDEIKDQGKHFCQYHGSATGHAIQECPNFLELVQKMMNEGELEFCGKIEEQNVSVLLKEELQHHLSSTIEEEVSKQQKTHLMSLPPDWL